MFCPREAFVHSCNVVFVVFPPQQAIRVRERARGREGVPIVWRISFSTGKIDKAITQIGRKIIVDVELALELAGKKTGGRK